MIVGKGIPNLLIAEGLLKILRDLIPPSPPKSLTNFHPWNGMTTKMKKNTPRGGWCSADLMTNNMELKLLH